MCKLRFTRTHEWVKVEYPFATVGITDYAQKELGDIVFIELPRVGEEVQQFARLGVIESTKTVSEFFSPLSGEVRKINSELIKNTRWINEDPYGKGWLVKLKISCMEEMDNLLDEESYQKVIKKGK